MATFEWNSSMNTGIAVIDEQHAELTQIINTLYYAYMDGEENSVLCSLIHKVNDYAHIHFETEVKLMSAYSDEIPDFELHLEQHREFFSNAIGFLLDYLNDKADITPELLDYLTDWWFNHINGIDRKMAEFLIQKGAA
ncbi:bacteriohemerythrin [Halodesulfovibrio sp.]|uniref:bacteriohemerythrin n=1 Tax=Halodesulfovibrio sp. TaxID=1912772 RepID=UPI0025D01089|nr:hemerythrin family protein [Halodesulfovibrio sp.]MCT4534716.1 hemerythrin family protein [Halodesulfovibrio sp.]MCT4628056.1 hemerythrin family protein [Halodesulfovibrio sp.]